MKNSITPEYKHQQAKQEERYAGTASK